MALAGSGAWWKYFSRSRKQVKLHVVDSFEFLDDFEWLANLGNNIFAKRQHKIRKIRGVSRCKNKHIRRDHAYSNSDV